MNHKISKKRVTNKGWNIPGSLIDKAKRDKKIRLEEEKKINLKLKEQLLKDEIRLERERVKDIK